MYLAAESMDARMLRLARNELAFGRHVPFAEVEEAMRSVRPSEVTALAARLLRAPLASVLLGPTPARIRDKARAILQTWLGPA